jgi:hypothetical protein
MACLHLVLKTDRWQGPQRLQPPLVSGAIDASFSLPPRALLSFVSSETTQLSRFALFCFIATIVHLAPSLLACTNRAHISSNTQGNGPSFPLPLLAAPPESRLNFPSASVRNGLIWSISIAPTLFIY